MRRSFKEGLGAFGVLLLAACTHVTNQPLCAGKACEYDSSAQTMYRFSPKAEKNTLVIVTLSGGGARAAALAFGTLQTLGQLPAIPQSSADGASSLLDQVDILSSVSGGSLTAGWYAVKGKAALETVGDESGKKEDRARLWHFLNKNWMPELIWKGLNPWSLVKYTFTSYERNDVLAEFYAQHFFGQATYLTVLEKYRGEPHQPYVILNATDLGDETIFPFTQGRFDLLCSDLTQYRLADAVAASSNFPLAFSPLGLENYSGCPAQESASWKANGPPLWIAHYAQFEGSSALAPLSIQLNQLRTARNAKDFLDRGDDVRYLHLLDGGVTDNLGVRSTLALEDDPARVPSLYLRLSGAKRPAGYQSIERIVYVVVNARTRDPALIDAHQGPPGEMATALHMADTQLDSSTLTDQDYLISELESMVYGTHGSGAFLSAKPEAQASVTGPAKPLRFHVVSVDFEMIPDKACRDAAWQLKTNWGLKENQAGDIVDLARVILSQSTDLKQLYAELGVTQPLLTSTKSFEEVCDSLRKHSK